MLRRPRALFAPFLVILLLVAGASPAVASRSPRAVAPSADTCAVLAVSTVGEAARMSEVSGDSADLGCWWFTPTADGAHAFRLSADDYWFAAELSITDPEGDVVLEAPWDGRAAIPTAALRAGTRYRIDVRHHPRHGDLSPFRVAAYDLSEGCAPLPEPRWDRDSTAFDVSADRLGCGRIETSGDTAVRLELAGDGGRMLVGLVDQDGAAHCVDRYPSGDTVLCRAVPAGRYRVVVGAGRSSASSIDLGAVPVDMTAGCTEMPLATYGEPLPATGVRAADGTGQECYSFTSTAGGPHDLRGWQHADRQSWAASYELWDATTDELLSQTTDWEREPLYPDQPSLVDLEEGHEHRVVVTGRPFADLGETVRPYDPRYRLGVLDRRSTEGCTSLRTGWQDEASQGRVEGGVVDCLSVDLPADTWARVDLRQGVAEPAPGLFGRILDASGDIARSDPAGTVCRFTGIGWQTTGSLSSECPLGGEGPFRLLLNGAWGVDGVDYAARVTGITDDDGCDDVPVAAWTRPLPARGTLDVGGMATDCWTFRVPRRGTYEPSMAEDVGRWAEREVQTYSAGDGEPVALWADPRPGRYRVVVAGDPGAAPAPYRLGVFDLSGDTSYADDPDATCPRLPSASVAAEPVEGTTQRGGWDCYRLPVGTRGPVTLRVEPRTDDTVVRAQLHDARGEELCSTQTGAETRCTIRSSGAHRVIVHHRYGEPDESSYRLSVRDPSDRQGCLPARSAGPNSGVVALDLPAGGAPGCVALGDGTRQLLWSVETADEVDPVVTDGDGEVVCTWEDDDGGARMCSPFEFRGHPAPYTVRLTNNDVVDHRARLLLRTDPASERGCSSAGYTPKNGPRPLRGTTAGGLDAECHLVPIGDGGYLLNRTNLDGAGPPDVLVFGPDGTVSCSGYGVDPVQTEPECYTRGDEGRYVFWVLGDEGTVGRYRVDLGCSNRRIGCAQLPEVSFTGSTVRGPVRVGQQERAGVVNVPPRGRVTWRWYVGSRLVDRTRTYTPKSADRGKDLQVRAIVTAPRYPRRSLRSPIGRIGAR